MAEHRSADEPERPPCWSVVAYRLRLRRLPEHHQAWVVADLARPGARRRFVTTTAAALLCWWMTYVVAFGLPTTTLGPLVVLFGGMLALVTRPAAWHTIEEQILRSHGVLTLDQLSGHRQGAGRWVDGQWWCDAHGNRYCRDCAHR